MSQTRKIFTSQSSAQVYKAGLGLGSYESALDPEFIDEILDDDAVKAICEDLFGNAEEHIPNPPGSTPDDIVCFTRIIMEALL